jgi:hypothetical protein
MRKTAGNDFTLYFETSPYSESLIKPKIKVLSKCEERALKISGVPFLSEKSRTLGFPGLSLIKVS